jgi:hypothetical protein
MSNPTTTTRRGNRQVGAGAPAAVATLNIEALSAFMDVQVYGEGQGPLYDLLHKAGQIVPKNTPATGLEGTFFENRDALKVGEAAYVWGQFDNTQIMIRVSEKGCLFAGVLHDKDVNPIVETEMIVCAVVTNRDFEFDNDGETVKIEKGTKFLKALPSSYVAKLKAAA